MSAIGKTMYEMACDHPDLCSEELESYDGGAWLYNTAEEARAAAYDYDWVHIDGKDYCPRHAPDREVCTCASAYGNFIGCKLHGIEADDTNREDGSYDSPG